MSADEPVPGDPVEAPPAVRSEPEAERRLASGIYGLIVASSVLAASAGNEDIAHVSLSVLVTLVVYWLAETYARIMAAQHVRGQQLGWARAGHDLRAGWPMVSASFTPLVAVVIAAALGVNVSTAKTIGLAWATILLFSSGWVSGRRRGMTGARLLLGAVIAASFGVALIALKTSLH
jgi:hypothetical protein